MIIIPYNNAIFRQNNTKIFTFFLYILCLPFVYKYIIRHYIYIYAYLLPLNTTSKNPLTLIINLRPYNPLNQNPGSKSLSISPIFIIKKIIAKFGLDPKNMEIDHVESEFRKKIGSEVHFSLETNGQYQNCNIESVNTNTLEEWKQQHKQSQQQTELEEDLTF